jgi:predicted amidohydrolase
VTTAAAAQLALQVGEISANRAAGLQAIIEAAAAGAQLVVLPELSDTGYAFKGGDEAARLADARSTVAGWAQAARDTGIVVVGGYCETDGGTLYNSAALVDDTGVRARYRKVHLWDREKPIFAAGDAPPPVVDTSAGRIAVMICYDLEFPEWVRKASVGGAEVIAVPANWPRTRPPGSERPMEVVKAQAAAATYGVNVVVADRCGRERGIDWVGGTMIADARGSLVGGPMSGGRPGMVMAEIDMAAPHDKRISDGNDLLADRRPELYG